MSKFDIYLNTERPTIVEKLTDAYSFAGVCCNPQMVARPGRTDLANTVKELRAATGGHKLFIQTPSNDYDRIMRDAEAVLKIAGEPTIIKIPSTTGDIRAMQKFSADVDICTIQAMFILRGMCASQSGVEYVPVLYCSMLMGGADDHGLYGGMDAKAVFAALNKFIQVSGSPARTMACAPKAPGELSYLMNTGATSVALDPEDFENCFNARLFINLNQDVRRSWEAVFSSVDADELIDQEKGRNNMKFKKNVLDRFRLDGKTAVVTGAAGNIGYYTALASAQAGVNMAIVDSPQCLERSRQVTEEFAGLYGRKAAAYGCDLVDAKAVVEMFDIVEKELGSTDVVHSNAGVDEALVPDLEAWDSEHNMDHLEHWKQVLNTNLASQYIVATTVARVMVREGHGGSTINIASLTGHIVNQTPPGHTQDDSSYGVSKAGVLYFTEHFASQVIQYGIRVDLVSPGHCYSPGPHAGVSQEMLECYQSTQPVVCMAQAEEPQGAVLYLASDASTYTVGQDILVDGEHANW